MAGHLTPHRALGRWLPALLALALAADLIAHTFPTEWVAFRAWEVVNRYPTGEGRFTPDLRYVNDRAYGDLAALANRPDWRVYRRETFTVDRFGFRNPPDIASASSPPDDLLIGDSFAAGSGLSDDETLAVELQRILGRRIYNGAELPITLRRLMPLIDRLGLTNGVVYYEYLEREPLPTVESVRASPKMSSTPLYGVGRSALMGWKGFWDVCPLGIWSHALYERMQDDHLLPNADLAQVRVERMRSGERALFLPDEVARFASVAPVDPSGVVALQSALRARGLTLRVVLTPEKYTVYAPLLEHPPTPPAALYLDRVEAALREAGVPVLNLLPSLRQATENALGSGPLPFLEDDTHWSAAGVRTAARAVRAAWAEQPRR